MPTMSSQERYDDEDDEYEQDEEGPGLELQVRRQQIADLLSLSLSLSLRGLAGPGALRKSVPACIQLPDFHACVPVCLPALSA